jgi:hypothetical protein
MIAPEFHGWPRDLIVLVIGMILGAGAARYRSWRRRARPKAKEEGVLQAVGRATGPVEG